jgi:aspartate aminotransferase
MIVTSYSKDLSIPGERIGFLAVNPQATYKEDLLAGMALANRILGYVNAPALMQRAIQSLQGVSVEFYLFPKSVVPDDVAFVKALQEELILTVPGSGFGTPGYFRIAFCVDDDTITRALPGFERVLKRF